MAQILLLKAKLAGAHTPDLFLATVPVRGHMRGPTFVAPHMAQREKRQAIVLAHPSHAAADVSAHAIMPPAQRELPLAGSLEPLEIRHHRALPGGTPDLGSCDNILVMFSGGKDSIAAVLALLEGGAPRDLIELWHHDIDGGAATLMDWPVTPAYCRAFARAIGVPIFFSWREGGFEREMNRNNAATAAVVFETPEGLGRAGGVSNKLGTREKFPQVSADLSVRWCSGALKVDVGAAAIRN